MDRDAMEPGAASREVSLSMPGWLVDEIDAEARRFGTTRQAVVNIRLGDYYEAKKARRSA